MLTKSLYSLLLTFQVICLQAQVSPTFTEVSLHDRREKNDTLCKEYGCFFEFIPNMYFFSEVMDQPLFKVPVSLYKSVNFGIPIIPLEQYHFNHEPGLTDSSISVDDKMNSLDLRVELKNERAPVVRLGLQMTHFRGIRNVSYLSGMMDFENKYQSWGLLLRTSYVYPSNGRITLLLTTGLGVRFDINRIAFQDELSQHLNDNYVRFGSDLLFGLALRLHQEHTFCQIEVAWQRIPTLSFGIGIK